MEESKNRILDIFFHFSFPKRIKYLEEASSRRILSRLLLVFKRTNFGRRLGEEKFVRNHRSNPLLSIVRRVPERRHERQNEAAWQGSEPFSRISSLRHSFEATVLLSFVPAAHDLFSLVPRDTCCLVTRGRAYISRSSRVHARACHTPDIDRLLSSTYYFKVT